MKTSKDIYVNTFREEVNCDQCNYFLSLVANLKQHMRFHTGLWMQAMLEEDLLFRICWTWKKQQNTTPRQQCFGLNDLGHLNSMESHWWDETNQMSTVSLWIAHTTILAIHYVKVYIFTSAVFWAQWPALVDFREESQLPVVPLHTTHWLTFSEYELPESLDPTSTHHRNSSGFYRPCLSTPSDQKSQGCARDPRRLVHNYTQSRALVSWSLTPRLYKPLFSLLPSPALVGFLAS